MRGIIMNNMSNNRKSNSNNSFKCSEVYGNGMRSRGAANRSNNYNQSVASRDRNQNSKNNMGQNKYGRVNNTLQKNFNKALYEGMYAEKKIERNFDPRLQQIYRANNANKNQNNKVEQGEILNLRNSDPVASSVNNKKRNNVNNRVKMVESKNNINNASNHHLRTFLDDNPQRAKGIPDQLRQKQKLLPVNLREIIGLHIRLSHTVLGFFCYKYTIILLHERL